MGNTLDREIQPGEVVVIDKQYLQPGNEPVEKRLFKVSGGFGASPDTMGSALFGEFLDEGIYCRMEGYKISPKETEKWQAAKAKLEATLGSKEA